MNELLLNRIVRSPSLPALPQVAVEVLSVGAEANQPAAANTKLAEVVSKDARLTRRLLRAVNSPFYDVKHECKTISQAISAIGGRAVKVLAIGMSMIDSLVHSQKVPFDADAYCRRTLISASAARLCAAAVEPGQIEGCFLAALLMDIGVMLLGDVLGEEYAKILAKAGDHSNLEAVEREMLDLTHSDVAGAMARHWKLPDVLQVPIAMHHNPARMAESPLKSLSEIACLAGQCADIFVGEDPAGSIADVRKILADRYGMDMTAVDALLTNVGDSAQALSPAFDLEPMSGLSFAAAQLRATKTARPISHNGYEGRERRRASRLSRTGFLTIRPYHEGVLAAPVRVRFRDASAAGIGLSHSLPFAAGFQFVIELPGSTKVKRVLYTVVWCMAISGEEFQLGARMVVEATAAAGDQRAVE